MVAAMLMANGATAREVLSTAALKQMSVEQLLEQEVLSTSRKPERWQQAPSSLFMIRGEGAQNAGATTLPQLLRLAPNLFVAQSSSSHWAVSARGFVRGNGYSNKLLVLMDGRSVYSPLFSNVFWDSQDVFVPDLDRVEVISGPNGSAWGSNGMNGVINIISKTAHETLGGVFYAEAGTETNAHFGVRHGVRFGETGAFRVYAKHADYDATLNADGVEDGLDNWTFSQTGFRADWGVSQQSTWTLQGDAFRGRFDNGTGPKAESDGANVQLRWGRILTADSHLTARVYHDYTMRHSPGAIRETSRATDFEIQHRLSYGNNQELLWGGSYRMMRDHVRDTVGFAILPADLNFDLGGLFVQHQTNFLDDSIRATLGYRAEHNHFSGWEHQPSLRVAWDAARGHMLWLSASRATRTPSRLDTGFFAPKEAPYSIAGGPTFVSEVLKAYEVGWRGRVRKDASVSATVFYHDYDDLRSVELTFPVVTANGVKGRSYGAEVFADWDVRSGWRLRVGYFHTEQETSMRAGSTDADRALGESSYPRRQLQLRNIFQLSRTVSLWTNLRSVGAVSMFENGRSDEVPAYTELDLRIAWTVSANLELALTGRNLLDRSHPEIGMDVSRREIQRSAHASVKWVF